MGTATNEPTNARIATALLLLALVGLVGAPTVAAEEHPQGGEDQGPGPCYWVSTSPPNAGISQDPVRDCL